MRKAVIALALLAGVVIAASLIAGMVLRQRVSEPYRGYAAAEQFVDIPPGTGTVEIGRRLVEAGVIRDGVTFRAALWWTGRERSLKAGEYRFAEPLTALETIDVLARGSVYARRLTFPEGLTIAEMAAIFESRGFGASSDFIDAAHDVSLVADLDMGADDLEGYLFPETYALPRSTPASRLVRLMVDQFRSNYSEVLRRSAVEQGLTTRQVVTLASLVEKETGRADERPLVSAVYRNRLTIGMGLQADPTVVYALQKAGRYDGNIRRRDLEIDSPYNTYRRRGLPPGPIAAPGRASLEAVLMPADVPYLYFVSRNDGSHAFAETLAAHNRNVREFQILYFRR